MIEYLSIFKEQLLGLSFYHIAVGYVVIRMFRGFFDFLFIILDFKINDAWRNKVANDTYKALMLIDGDIFPHGKERSHWLDIMIESRAFRSCTYDKI